VIRKLAVYMILLMITGGAAGQDPFFSSFYSSILYLNPAFTGTAQLPRISASYRNQAPALGSPFVTYLASYDQPVEILGGGLGVSLSNDVQGPGIMNRMSADALYAYHLAVSSKLTVSAGFQASYSYRLLRTGDFILPDGLDPSGIYIPTETLADQRRGHPDFAVGFLAFNRNIYGGVTMHHLTKPNQSLSKSQHHPLPRKLTVHGGMKISLYERRFGREALQLNPNLVYIHQAGFRQLNYGLEGLYRGIIAGVWIRHAIDFRVSAASLHFGYDQEWFRIGYSHDFNMSNPWKEFSNMGAHEINLLIKLENKSGNRSNPRAIICPKI
jgi:type IX secretion system PorP/SprF family membrane protein